MARHPGPRPRRWSPVLLLLPLVAAAQGGEVGADGLLEASRQAGREGRPADEAAACEALLDHPDASARGRRTCTARLAWLDARRDADGSLASLATLEALRRGSAGAAGEGEARARALLEAPGTAPRVRREARLWLARRLDAEHDDPAGVLALTEPVLAELDAAEPADQLLGELHVTALARLGREPEARAAQALLDRPRSATPQEGLALVLREQRRDRLDRASGAVLGLFAVLSVPLTGLALRRRRLARPRGLVTWAACLLATLALVGAWDRSVLPGLMGLGLALALVQVLALGLLTASPPGPLRGAARLLAALAALACLWLGLHAADLLGYLGL